MGLLEQIEQKAFLGSEFLTWLWHRSERDGQSIEIPGEDPVEVSVEGPLTLEAEFGEATTINLRGGETPGAAPEAGAGLLAGKKLKRAKFRMAQGEMEWTFSLRGDTLDFSGIKIPAPRGLPFEEGVSLRMQAAERLFELSDALFEAFLAIRLDSKRWGVELEAMREWVAAK